MRIDLSKTSIATIATIAMLLGLSAAFVVSGIMQTQAEVTAEGTLTGMNVGLYTDATCTQNCTSLSWGSVTPGVPVTRTIYIKNTGAMPETLGFLVKNWTGQYDGHSVNMTESKIAFFQLSWSIDPVYVLPSGNGVYATFTLEIANTIAGVDTFGFTIQVTGSQAS